MPENRRDLLLAALRASQVVDRKLEELHESIEDLVNCFADLLESVGVK